MWPAFPPQCETEPTVSWRRGSTALGGRTYTGSYTLGQANSVGATLPSPPLHRPPSSAAAGSAAAGWCSIATSGAPADPLETGNDNQFLPARTGLPHAPITSGLQHHFLNRKTKSLWKCSPAKYSNTFLEASLMPSAAEFTTFNYICHEMIYKQKLQKGSWEPVKGRPFHLQEGNQSSSRPARPLLAASPPQLFPAWEQDSNFLR